MSENKRVEIYESNLQAAYQVANENGGDERMIRLLDALTGKTASEGNRPKPSLDDYKTIQSYEDACEALGENPILSEDREKALCAQFPDHWDYRQDMPKHIVALMKLETISRALLGRMRVSVLRIRIIAPRTRLRALGSACARKMRRKRNTSESGLSSSGLITWLSISPWEITSNDGSHVD